MNKKAFTLAEVMIVLMVIGVLIAILFPVTIQSMPDENLMKFKKAHNTLGTVIRELVMSDEYYLDGDLGVKANGEVLKSGNENDIKYLCQTIADVVNAKKVNCSIYGQAGIDLNIGQYDIRKEYNSNYKNLDTTCKENTLAGEEIILNNDVVFYQVAPFVHFGYVFADDSARYEKAIADGLDDEDWYHMRFYTTPCERHCDDNIPTSSALYRVFCIDIDGINKGEDPFGYGIRVDGKTLVGKRATEWLEREVNEE